MPQIQSEKKGAAREEEECEEDVVVNHKMPRGWKMKNIRANPGMDRIKVKRAALGISGTELFP